MQINKSTLKTAFIMLLLQVTVLAVLAFNASWLLEVNLDAVLFWLLSALSYVVYFFTTQSCPGFVTAKELAVIVGKLQIDVMEKSVSFEINTKGKDNNFCDLKNDGADGPSPNFNQPKIEDHINTYRSEGDEEKENTQNHIEDQVEDIKITEVRHCTVCNIDQPNRTKHCRECGKCIATHDHHCPWLGVCIGEKNKKRFYWYLVVQLAHLLWTFFIVKKN
jgi:hypothetical protein